jgi:hypothetical protein
MKIIISMLLLSKEKKHAKEKNVIGLLLTMAIVCCYQTKKALWAKMTKTFGEVAMGCSLTIFLSKCD